MVINYIKGKSLKSTYHHSAYFFGQKVKNEGIFKFYIFLFQLKLRFSLGRSATTSTVTTKRTITANDSANSSVKIRENGADDIEHHEVVLRMDPEGFDFSDMKPKITEASLV